MKLNFLGKRHAIACFFFLLSNVSSALTEGLPPGMISGFSINECSESVCFTITGSVGFTSKLGDIFSSEKTKVIVFQKLSLTKTEYFCDEFKLEVSDKIGTCSNNATSQFTEFNFVAGKVKQIIF